MVVIVIILSNNFYWSILDFQCCANFSCTANIYRLFFQIFFLTCVSPYRVLSRVPCAYSRSLLVIYFIYSTVAWKNPMDGGAWQAAVHGVEKSWTRLSNFTFTFHFHALEKEMATHSSVLAWRIPGTGKPGGLPSMRSHRVGHD